MCHERRCIVQLWTQASSCYALQYLLLIARAYLKGKGLYTNVFIEISYSLHTHMLGLLLIRLLNILVYHTVNVGVSSYMVPSLFTESYDIHMKRVLV